MTNARVLFLGTGGSMGIPVIGCECKVCKSANTKNHRMRPSVLLQYPGKQVLVDCGPDFHQQALKYGVNHLDGVILTHAHNDHTAGLDELRALFMVSKTPMQCLLSKETLSDIARRYDYMMKPPQPVQGITPLISKFTFEMIPEDTCRLSFLGVNWDVFSYRQIGMKVNGFRSGNFAYVTDIRDFSEDIFTHLQGLDTLVVSALRFTPSPFHLTVDEAIEFVRKTGAKTAYFNHIAHELEHEIAEAYLPDHIHCAYDGLELQVNLDLIV
jgi:phosphoribosyl 1,2-cyclic phosphate phosphodiesterase